MKNDVSKFDYSEVDDEIRLPIRKNDLGDFISKLLGQQQSIERIIDQHFDINHAWLLNLHEIVNQRINQQASANLVAFKFVVYFEDGGKRTLNTVEAFKTYIETRSSITEGINIYWSYIVSFPSKSTPEKQEISLSAHRVSTDKFKSESASFTTRIFNNYVVSGSERSLIGLDIYHTERTWGDDLEVIISKEIDKITRRISLFHNIADVARLCFATFIMLFCMAYPIFSITESKSTSIEKLDELFLSSFNESESDLETINRKLDFFQNYLSAIGSKGEDYIIILTFIGPILCLLFLTFTKRSFYSFLVFSDADKKSRGEKLKSENKSFFLIVASYIIAILCGVSSNYLYSWLIN